MPRGGRRQGTPGRAYTNRSDLNQRAMPVQAASGQPYGARAEQERAQRAVPIAAPPAAPAHTAGGMAAPPPVPLDAPSGRPGEPVTHGAPLGAGAGREAVAAMGFGGDDLDELRALYQRFPLEELRQIIEEAEGGGL